MLGRHFEDVRKTLSALDDVRSSKQTLGEDSLLKLTLEAKCEAFRGDRPPTANRDTRLIASLSAPEFSDVWSNSRTLVDSTEQGILVKNRSHISSFIAAETSILHSLENAGTEDSTVWG